MKEERVVKTTSIIENVDSEFHVCWELAPNYKGKKMLKGDAFR